MLRLNIKRTVTGVILIILLTLKLYNYKDSIKNLNRLNATDKSQYVVNSSKCKILNLNPFDISILRFIKKEERAVCVTYPPLTTVTFNHLTEQHILQVNYSALPFHTNSSDIRCCLKRLTGGDYYIIYGPCQYFSDQFLMDDDSKFVFVFCLDHNGKIFYENMHAAVVKWFNVGKKNPNSLNVLLIGFDSMSRLNFYRTLTKTATHLHTNGWVEMKGYNKIADNTLPNMMAFLAGLSPEVFGRAQNLNLDEFPYIWKEFSSAGYVTAYAEDQPLVSTFHCHLQGFKHVPTNHYFRDYMMAGELLFMGGKRAPGCIADRLATNHILDYLLDFTTVYKNDSFFGLFWMNQISHNNLNRASSEDETVLEVLKRLEDSGAMNTTMVVILSDHGLRVGDFRTSRHGWYEDRLPLMFISLPEWYKTIKDLHYSNLLKNSERLTSPYDLYLTMKYVLSGTESSAPGCLSCKSLFTEVDPDRSCAEAGISPHWCACHPFEDVPVSEHRAAAESVVLAINEKLSDDPDIDPYFECEQLELKDILYVREKMKPGVNELIVGVVTEPGDAQFEATVSVHEGHFHVDPSISRMTSYGNESSCAENPVSKLFCYCRQIIFID